MGKFDNARIEDEVLFPIKRVMYEGTLFKPEDLTEPLEAACRDLIMNSHKIQDKESKENTFLNYLGLKALKLQAEKLDYIVNPIRWEWWSDNQLKTNFYIEVHKKNERKQSWQVYSYRDFSQFLLLDTKSYKETGYYKYPNSTYDIKYSRIFMQRIKISEKDQFNLLIDELLTSKNQACYKNYLSKLTISYDSAKYVSMEQLAKNIIQPVKIVPKETIIRANKDNDTQRKMQNDCYYISLKDMTELNN